VSGHRGDPSAETNPTSVVVVGRLNADGTPDTSFGDGGFAEVDLGPGVEQSLAVAPLSNGDVVALVNANEEDGGSSVYLVRFDAAGQQVTGSWGAPCEVELMFHTMRPSSRARARSAVAFRRSARSGARMPASNERGTGRTST
jgi:hypothetical protein